ncbi:hypothetical protein DNK44_10990 [Pseudomonas dryadis]|uniref:Uncharacterized protein n=1 Tax=Phytopseudomonas dryadis TaxID=2487520 RepID=A0A4Q9R1T0_9GAMM|nr:hypothetical protein DNK44_10990 [Pseudomonas dryadis]
MDAGGRAKQEPEPETALESWRLNEKRLEHDAKQRFLVQPPALFIECGQAQAASASLALCDAIALAAYTAAVP